MRRPRASSWFNVEGRTEPVLDSGSERGEDSGEGLEYMSMPRAMVSFTLAA